MKVVRSFIGIVVLCSVSILFTACPGADDPEPTPNPPINNSGGISGGDNNGGSGNNSGDGSSTNSDQPDGYSNDRGSISYKIDDKTFKTVLVGGGSMGDFYMMQTEIPPGGHVLVIDGKEYCLDFNGDYIITKIELYCLLNDLRADTGLPWRLPTRDEWMYAAKGGKFSSQNSYSGSNSIDDVAWYKNNSSNKAHEVATKKANELELYDMSGNYAELCFNDTGNNPTDGYTELEKEADVDGDFYGGCWNDSASECTIVSYKKGSVTGKLKEGSDLREKYAVDARYVSVRLVYSR